MIPMTRLGAALVAFAMLGACHSVDLSFKTITFENADRDQVFDACLSSVRSHFTSVWINADKAAGRIETDPIEETLEHGPRREQCYVQVRELEQRQVEVALMAPLSKLEVDPNAQVAARWKVLGSDVRVEGILLDEIAGLVQVQQSGARVISTTLPEAARPRE